MRGIFIMLGILLLSGSSALAQQLNLTDIRRDFNKGVKDEKLCKQYYTILKEEAKTTLEKGYEGAFQMFMAKHTGNPIKKMSFFNGGKKVLESQIKADPNNAELRFIRLCIQAHIPSYLGYKEEIPKDKDFLVKNLYKIEDGKTKTLLYNYLKGANIFSADELSLLGR
ncbi:hypothetical protein ACL9RF_06745 [Sphingobacterium sp. Mn56C]|uniref:hypothetical protein n=1 Tax=Sphingobacterium sp. Mn56C TaxID=3395261 RepID=UPI003BC2AFC2